MTDDVIGQPKVDEYEEIRIIAREVLAGCWGQGHARYLRPEAAGINPDRVRAEVIRIINNGS